MTKFCAAISGTLTRLLRTLGMCVPQYCDSHVWVPSPIVLATTVFSFYIDMSCFSTGAERERKREKLADKKETET